MVVVVNIAVVFIIIIIMMINIIIIIITNPPLPSLFILKQQIVIDYDTVAFLNSESFFSCEFLVSVFFLQGTRHDSLIIKGED